MKPNTPMLELTTGLITRSPAATHRTHFPINITAQLRGDLLGFTQCVQPNLPGCVERPIASSRTWWIEKAYVSVLHT
jgi:hypothetical protein